MREAVDFMLVVDYATGAINYATGVPWLWFVLLTLFLQVIIFSTVVLKTFEATGPEAGDCATPTGPRAERAFKRLKKMTGQEDAALKKEKNRARAARRKKAKKKGQAATWLN